MGDIDGDSEGFSSQARASIRVRFLVRCTLRLGFWLGLRSRFNVRVKARLRFSVTVRCG